MSSNGLTITIPQKNNKDWFNNFIVSLFYSQYSRELILNKETIKQEIEDIFDFKNNKKIADIFNEYVKIVDKKNGTTKLAKLDDDNKDMLDFFDDDTKIKILIDINFYNYLLTHNKQLTAFILPKFLEFIESSCIAVERYNGKNYIGLYDLVKYKPPKTIMENVTKLFNGKKGEEFKLNEKIKQSDIKKIFTESKDYIIINKWENSIPSIFGDITKDDNDNDDSEGINNKYRLSSIYKNKDDLNITDKIEEQISYNGYYYKLDSCIITNDRDVNDDESQLITCLTHNGKRYIYIGKNCEEIHEYDWLKKEFSLYSVFPCELFTSKKIDKKEKDKLSTYDIKKNNYTLIYVKGEKIDVKKAEEKQKEIDKQKAEEEKQKKAEEEQQKKQAKQKEDRLKEEKLLKLAELEKETKQQKEMITKLNQKLKNANEEDIKKINDIEKKIKSIKKDEYNQLKILLVEYINLLRNDETEEFKEFKDSDYIKKISEIEDEIKKFNTKKETLQQRPQGPQGSKIILDKIDNFSIYCEDINLYLNKYKYYIINFLARQNTIELLKDEIAKLPKDDKTREILDAISKLPKEATKKLVDDLNVKIDTMQQTLLTKLQEQKDVGNSRNNITLESEISELKQLLQLLGNIHITLSETVLRDNKKLVDDLNIKLDTMKETLLSKLQEQIIKSSSSSNSSSRNNLQSEITSLNKQLELLENLQIKLSQNGDRDNKQLLADMKEELLKYSKKDNELIIKGIQDLLRDFNKEVISKQNQKNDIIHREIDGNIKEQLIILKDIQLKLDKGSYNSKSNSRSKKEINENDLLKLENTELKKQIDILNDIKDRCHKQQKEYERCNKHNMLPYKYIKFKEDELLDSIRENFKSQKKPSDKIIIDFIFKYFEKNNKVMNIYIIEKYMGDIYDVMKIFNKKYNIDEIDIKHFYRLLASISIYGKFNDEIKKIFIK